MRRSGRGCLPFEPVIREAGVLAQRLRLSQPERRTKHTAAELRKEAFLLSARLSEASLLGEQIRSSDGGPTIRIVLRQHAPSDPSLSTHNASVAKPSPPAPHAVKHPPQILPLPLQSLARIAAPTRTNCRSPVTPCPLHCERVRPTLWNCKPPRTKLFKLGGPWSRLASMVVEVQLGSRNRKGASRGAALSKRLPL